MSHFSKLAAEVKANILKTSSAADKDAEWQRVNSYIADVLKDSHVLYAKLARLQGDFVGEEFDRLAKISEAVLHIGDELSAFSKAFYEGKYDMAQTEFNYGTPHDESQGGDQQAPAPAPAPQQTSAPASAPAPEKSESKEPMAFGDSGEQGQGGGGQHAPAQDDEEGEPPAEDYSGEDDEEKEKQ